MSARYKTQKPHRMKGYARNLVISTVLILLNHTLFAQAVTDPEELFSDGLLDEVHYLAGESDQIDPPESEMDILKDSDGFLLGQ